MSEKPNYHTLPCGTPIPPEGIRCRVWDHTEWPGSTQLIIAHNASATYPFIDIDGDCWLNAVIEEGKV